MLRKIEQKEYEEFAIAKDQDHFLHSVQWAKAREKINWSYDIIGYKSPLQSAALIMYKKFPRINKYYAYISRGFITDYTNEELLKEFLKELRKYLKTKNVVSLTIDPDIIYNHLDIDYNVTAKGKNADLIFENLVKNGFVHQGFYNEFEGIQPRHTFRIGLENLTIDEVLKKMAKSNQKYIKTTNKLLQSGDLQVEVNTEDSLDRFYNLMLETTKRDGFTSRDKQYYQNIIDEFRENIQILTIFTNPKKLYEQKSQQLNEYNKYLSEAIQDLSYEELSKKGKIKYNEARTKQKALIEEIKGLEKYKDCQRKDLSSSFLLLHNKKAWHVYGTSSDDLRRYHPTYLIYNEMIKYCIEKEVKWFDLFGVAGTSDKASHAYGLYQFKKGFGGDLIEFIGEFDLVINKFYYSIYKTVFPKIKNVRKNLGKR